MPNVELENGTRNYVNCAMVAGTTSTYTTTVTTSCIVNGKFATPLTAQTNTATPTTDANTGVAFVALAPNQCCAILFGLSAAGAIQMAQGPIIACGVGVTTTVGALMVEPQFPAVGNWAPLAYTIVRTAPSAAAWTPGTSNWTASGVSCSTFQNIGELPNRPQAS